MLTYYNCRVFNELNFYSLSLFSTCFYSIFLYFSFKFHKITVKSGVDLSHGANWTRIVTSYFSVDAYSHLFMNFATRFAKFFVFFLKKSDFLIKRIFQPQILGNQPMCLFIFISEKVLKSNSYSISIISKTKKEIL